MGVNVNKVHFFQSIPSLLNTDFKTKKKKLSNINTLQISNKDEPKRGALQAFQAGDCRKTGDGEQYAEHKTAEHRC